MTELRQKRLPEGWVLSSLSRVADITMGQSPDSKYYTTEEVGLPFLQGCAEFQNRFPNTTTYCSHGKKFADKKAILFSVRAPVGKINIADQKYIIGRGLAAIMGSNINQNFLEQRLIFNEPQFRAASQGSTFEAINSSELNEWPIEYPSCQLEQSKIAEILSTVDHAIAQTETLLSKQQRIKTGLMQDLLTRGIDEHGNLRSEATHPFKDSSLGRIPVEWEVYPIERLGDIVTGSTPDTAQEIYYGGNKMFVTPKDIEAEADHITTTERFLTLTGLKQCRVIPKNTICTVCIGSTIGKIGLTTSECTTNQQINSLIPTCEEDAYLLLYSMKLFLPAQLRRDAGLQAVPIVNKSTFSQLLLPLPDDSNEKQAIQQHLAVAGEHAKRLTVQISKLNHLKTALMQDLLTGRKRVTSLLPKTANSH